MIRPTPRAALLFAVTQTMAFVMMAWNRDAWPVLIGLGSLTLCLIGLDALMGVAIRDLTVATRAPARMFVGTKSEIVVDIVQTTRPKTATFVVLAEQSGEVGPPQVVSVLYGGDGSAVARLPIEAVRRGVISIDAVWLRCCGPLGLAERIWRTPVGKTIDVLPDIRGVRSVAIQFFSRESINGVKPQPRKGEGTEFESLRDHAPGFDNRFIDWKRSAKHRKLLSKEFKTEQNDRIILAFDTGRLMSEPIDGLTRLDHAINAGLLLGWVSLRAGDLVGVYAFDAQTRHYIQPGRGMQWFPRLQRGASQLAYQSRETNFTLGLAELNARLKRRALVVLFTEFIDTTTAELLIESLQRTANRHATVFVALRDPRLADLVDAPPDDFPTLAEAVVAHDFQRDRAVVFGRLERMGVHCLDSPTRGLSANLINRYLLIKERGEL